MDFKEALQTVLRTNQEARKNYFLLYAHISDLLGNDYKSKEEARAFYLCGMVEAAVPPSPPPLPAPAAPPPAPAAPPKRKRRKRLPPPSEDAYVYFAYPKKKMHLSRGCPCLKNEVVLYRGVYRFEKGGKASPALCDRCGEFKPRVARGIFYRLYRFLCKKGILAPRRKVLYND